MAYGVKYSLTIPCQTDGNIQRGRRGFFHSREVGLPDQQGHVGGARYASTSGCGRQPGNHKQYDRMSLRTFILPPHSARRK